MRLDFFSLKLFVAVAEERSIAQAAAREHVVASAVSKRIAMLEDDLQVVLLRRHAKGVDLTAAGSALLQRARDILRSVEATGQEMREFAADGSAHIRLAANHSSIVEFLPADLAEFARDHPRTRIDLNERFSIDVVRAVADGLADVGVYCAPAAAPGVVSVAYRQDELVLAVPAGHPLAKRRRVAFAQAIHCQFIGYFPTLSIASVYPAMAERAPWHVRIQIANFDATCRMAKAGLGLALVPLESARPHILDKRLVCVRLSDEWARRQLWLCRRDSGQAGDLASEFVDYLGKLATRRGKPRR